MAWKWFANVDIVACIESSCIAKLSQQHQQQRQKLWKYCSCWSEMVLRLDLCLKFAVICRDASNLCWTFEWERQQEKKKHTHTNYNWRKFETFTLLTQCTDEKQSATRKCAFVIFCVDVIGCICWFDIDIAKFISHCDAVTSIRCSRHKCISIRLFARKIFMNIQTEFAVIDCFAIHCVPHRLWMNLLILE